MTLALGVWLALAVGFTLTALVKLRGRPHQPGLNAKVVLVRPVDAPTALELENLRAPLPPNVEQVVLSPFRLELPQGTRWLPSDPPTPNRKAGHLAYAAAALELDGCVLVSADADVRVDAALLTALVRPVLEGAALCTAEVHFEGAPSFGAAALRGLLNHSHQNFRAVDAVTFGARAACGKAMALGPAALRELKQLTHYIGEDLELAIRLHGRGERVDLALAPARVPQGRVGLGGVFARVRRWMVVLSSHRPWLALGIPALFACTVPLCVAAFWHGHPLVVALAGLLLAARLALSLKLERRVEAVWEWALGELLLLAAFFGALGRHRVTWRGRHLRIVGRGAIVAESGAPA